LLKTTMTAANEKTNKSGTLIYARYSDHVYFNRSSASAMKPQVRECVGWLVFNGKEYLILAWDRDAEPPTLKGGDPKASGLVLLKSEIIELRRLEVSALPLQKNSNCHLNSAEAIVKDEYALPPTERKTQRKRKGKTAT
jgi:hypothetical protein